MQSGSVYAVCISEQKGTPKSAVSQGVLLANHGLLGDAHAGNWHRQVSILSRDAVEDFMRRGAKVSPGDFGENILVKGIEPSLLAVGTLLRCKDALLQITQIGKQCHNHCAIYHQVGECIMPHKGVFAKVLCGGTISEGDVISIEPASETNAP